MQNLMNRRWLLTGYPAAMPTPDNWTMDTQPVPDPGAGQILVKAKWLSVDPYMRGRMSPATNYTKGVAIGEVMQGGGVGEVVASNHPAWKVGDIAESMSFGWQEWSVLTPDIAGPAGVNRIDPELAPIESSLSWLGMPGLTAYFGLLELGRPRPGDAVVVSAASGAVGQLVGQIAKLAGCRAVAIAGSDDKLKWCREIGFDATINYKKTADLTAAVKEACLGGVDVFFDNTAGPIHDAVMKNLSIGARVVICGRVALAGQFGKLTLANGSWVISSSRAPVSTDFWYSTGGTDGVKLCNVFPIGNERGNSPSKKMCLRGSNTCQKHSFGCCKAETLENSS